MLLGREHGVLAKVASKDQGRPILKGIHVTPEYAQAADGYMMVRIPSAGIGAEEPPKAGKAIPQKGITVLAEVVKEATKGLPTNKGLPLAQKVVAVGRRNGRAILATTDTTREAKLLGTYPAKSLDALMPERKPHQQTGENSVICLAPSYLAIIAQVAKAVGASSVRFQSENVMAPIRLDFCNGEERRTVGIIMPMATPYDKYQR